MIYLISSITTITLNSHTSTKIIEKSQFLKTDNLKKPPKVNFLKDLGQTLD